MPDDIIVRLNGGLGNQLFQYAAGLGVANKLGCNLTLDVSRLENPGPGITPRQFELGFLTKTPKIVRVPEPPAFLNKIANSRHGWLANTSQRLSKQFFEQGRRYDPRIEKISRGTVLNGYFQSPRYFQGVELQLVDELLDSSDSTRWFEEMKQQISSPSSVAIHVRRGDYLTQPAGSPHAPLSLDYYQRALARFQRDSERHTFYIFSDDPNVRPAEVGLDKGMVTIVKPPTYSPPIESLRLIAQASMIITANSSFSWWAGWLGSTRSGANVFMPSPWFADEAFLNSEAIFTGAEVIDSSWVSTHGE